MMYTPLVKRTQIYLDEDVDARLREQADHEGRSAAAIIRDAVRAYLEAAAGDDRAADPMLAIAGRFTGGPRDAAERHDAYLYGETPRRR
jgi:predicted transcriptional regulator